MRVFSIIIALILATSLMAAGQVSSFALGGVDETVAVVAKAVKSEDLNIAGPTLDNFNDNGKLNLWGGETGGFDDGKSGECISLNDSASPYEGNFCLKLNYLVNAADGYAGYYSKLQSKNLENYDNVSFYVKGSAGGELFKIEFKNNSSDVDRNHAAVYVTDYLDNGITTNWQKVTIPLHNFVNINDWTSAKEFIITFENSASVVNGSPTSGIVYFDKIEFDTVSPNQVRVDFYGDKVGTCALGGNMGDMGGSGGSASHTFSSVVGRYHDNPNGLVSSYSVNTGYAGHFIMFGGGDTGWLAMTHDFSEFNKLVLWVRAKSSTENPKVVKIELVDVLDEREKVLVNINTIWQKYEIPLSDFSNLHKSYIKQMNIVYEDWRISGAGGNKTGVLFIDEIRFEK